MTDEVQQRQSPWLKNSLNDGRRDGMRMTVHGQTCASNGNGVELETNFRRSDNRQYGIFSQGLFGGWREAFHGLTMNHGRCFSLEEMNSVRDLTDRVERVRDFQGQFAAVGVSGLDEG